MRRERGRGREGEGEGGRGRGRERERDPEGDREFGLSIVQFEDWSFALGATGNTLEQYMYPVECFLCKPRRP